MAKIKRTQMIYEAPYEIMHEYGLNPATREMWIHGVDHQEPGEGEPGVEYMMANRAIKNLNFFKQESQTKELTIHLHTCGGDWEHGMAIFDAIESMPYPVIIIGYAEVRSMSSIIFQAADYRILMPHTIYLMHYGTFAMDADSKTVISNVEREKKCNEIMLDIYTECSKLNRLQLKNKLDQSGDVILDAKEALALGFCDEVLE